MYHANENRYDKMIYRRLGKSGLKLPVISLGFWYNFGDVDHFNTGRDVVLNAFDQGITHFDLANNYGPPAGAAEKNFGRILNEDLKAYRDELIISSKAGYYMWKGPYGDGGSRKYLIASLDQSLKRMHLDYVDIFYHHRPDYEMDLEETMVALSDIVRQGKALYVGLSNYKSDDLKKAVAILKALHAPYVITQPSYSMLNRWIEADNLLDTQYNLGGGTICFSVLQQGLLTNKYISNIPSDSRALKAHCEWLNKENLTPELLQKLSKLNEIAQNRNQSLSQLAIAWALRNEKMTSVLMGVSKVKQLHENIKALDHLEISKDEEKAISNLLNSLSL